MAKKLILHDYQTVAELIKAFKVKVERKGDDYSGIYWEVTMYGSKLRNDSKESKGNGRRAVGQDGRGGRE